MEAKNILNYSYEFYELCAKEGWTDADYEDFEELSMFEGDPNIIHINGQLGFFIEYEGIIWYYFDEDNENIDKILLSFFEKRLGKERLDDKFQKWDYFNNHNAIAYRGGCGYAYSFFCV